MQPLCFDYSHDLPGQHRHCPSCGAVTRSLPGRDEAYQDHAWHCEGGAMPATTDSLGPLLPHPVNPDLVDTQGGDNPGDDDV